MLKKEKIAEEKIDIAALLKDYEKKSRRLEKIIKQSDRQQFDMIKLNEELDEHKNYLEQKVFEKTKELHELNKNLEQRVKDEVEANRLKDKQLNDQAKFAQLGELISNIAHQWRQPLNAISSAATGMQAMRELGMSNEEDENIAIQRIANTTQTLSSIINDFRDFVNQKSEKSDVVIQSLIQTTINIISSSLQNDNIKIITLFPKQDIKILTISASLSQVILNIIKNSQDALVKLDNSNDKTITIELSKLDNNLEISIKDNANGIDNKLLSKIFDPYFTTKHQSQGVGLGLYIVKESMQKHLNGTVDVKTSSDGTEFLLKLNNK